MESRTRMVKQVGGLGDRGPSFAEVLDDNRQEVLITAGTYLDEGRMSRYRGRDLRSC